MISVTVTEDLHTEDALVPATFAWEDVRRYE